MSRQTGSRVTETEMPITPRRTAFASEKSRVESVAVASTPTSAPFSSPPKTPRGSAFLGRASASPPVSQPYTPTRATESPTSSFGGGGAAVRRPLHTPPVLLPSLRDSIGTRHYTPSPPRSPVPAQQQQQEASASTPSPSPRRRPQAMYDAAGTVDLAGAAIGTTAPSPSRAPASVPLQQTPSTDSATSTTSSATSAMSTTSDPEENENSWASSWIDHELEFGDESLASNLKVGTSASSRADGEKEGEAVRSSPFRVGGIFGAVGGPAQSFAIPVDGDPDLGESEEDLTALTPMAVGPSSTSVSPARTDSLPLPLPTVAPLFSSAAPTRQKSRPASPQPITDSRPGRALDPDGGEKPRPLSEFDWAAAYGEAPTTDYDVGDRTAVEAATTSESVQGSGKIARAGEDQNPPAVSDPANGTDPSIASAALASDLSTCATREASVIGPPRQSSVDPVSSSDPPVLPADSGPSPNPPMRPLSWIERPVSRASVRSNASGTSLAPGSPAPPRPPRRQPSNVSLASMRGPGPAATASPIVPTAAPLTSTVEAPAAIAVAVDSPRPESVATSSSYATADASPSIPSSSQSNRHSRTFSGDAVASAYRAPLTPSPARKERGPAPVVPVKSARRASLLVRQRSGEAGRAARKPSAVEIPSPVRKDESERTGVREDSPATEAVSSSLAPVEAVHEPLRDSAAYDLADIADIYARNSLYYPPPDETPRASRALQHAVDLTEVAVSPGASASLTSASANREASAAALFATTGLPPTETSTSASSPTKITPLIIPDGRASSEQSPRTARGDAKARAAAFIDDLKRAKAAEAASLDPGVPDSTNSTSALASTYEMVSRESTPPPPPPPPSSTKRPSEDMSNYSDASRRPSYDVQNRSVSNLVGSRRASETTLPTSATISGDLRSFASQVPLFRRRPLPTAVIIASELRSAASTRERCRIYEQKLNELGRARSRLDEWVLAVSEGHESIRASPDVRANSPIRSRRGRQESSSSTFAPRGDSYRATEITRGSFSSHDAVPSAPFPGVLGLTPTRSTSHTSFGSGLGSASSGAGSKSFFSGLGRGSLGRRMSKREHGGGPPSRSSAKSSIRSTISGPVQIISSTNTALAPVSDDVFTRTSPSGGHRASFDSRVSSPAQSPKASRNSFAYGSSTSLPPSSASIPTFQVTRGSVYYDNGEKDTASQVADLDEEKLSRLADILPQATRADLAAALEDAGGDDVLAISVYLSSH